MLCCPNIGALIIIDIIPRVPFYTYSIVGPLLSVMPLCPMQASWVRVSRVMITRACFGRRQVGKSEAKTQRASMPHDFRRVAGVVGFCRQGALCSVSIGCHSVSLRLQFCIVWRRIKLGLCSGFVRVYMGLYRVLYRLRFGVPSPAS